MTKFWDGENVGHLKSALQPLGRGDRLCPLTPGQPTRLPTV